MSHLLGLGLGGLAGGCLGSSLTVWLTGSEIPRCDASACWLEFVPDGSTLAAFFGLVAGVMAGASASHLTRWPTALCWTIAAWALVFGLARERYIPRIGRFAATSLGQTLEMVGETGLVAISVAPLVLAGASLLRPRLRVGFASLISWVLGANGAQLVIPQLAPTYVDTRASIACVGLSALLCSTLMLAFWRAPAGRPGRLFPHRSEANAKAPSG